MHCDWVVLGYVVKNGEQAVHLRGEKQYVFVTYILMTVYTYETTAAGSQPIAVSFPSLFLLLSECILPRR